MNEDFMELVTAWEIIQRADDGNLSDVMEEVKTNLENKIKASLTTEQE